MGGQERLRAIADINLRIDLQRMMRQAQDRDDGPLVAILGAAIRTLDARTYQPEGATLADVPPPSDILEGRSVRVNGRRNTVKLEPEFWGALDTLVSSSQCSLSELCEAAWRRKGAGTLASALRVFVLDVVRRGHYIP